MSDERILDDNSPTVPLGTVGGTAEPNVGGALGASELRGDARESEEGISGDGGADTDAMPGGEVSVVRDEDLAGGTDPRGIMERIVDAVTQDGNEHIDRKSGPSI